MRRVSLLSLLIAIAVSAAACGGDDTAESADTATATAATATAADTAEPTGDDVDATGTATGTAVDTATATDTAAPKEPMPRSPSEITDAADTGDGVITPLFNAPLPEGWTETEYLFGGEATSYTAMGDLTDDGVWTAEEDATAPYRTRMIVRTPPATDFSGVVFVEWFNVTAGTDSSPDWGYVAEELARSGHAYVGVSVQAVGVNGAEDSRLEAGLVDTRGLVVRDPARYGTLEHPGDAFAFDIFTQAGVAAAGADGTDVLGGLEATHVIGMGESQSAIFLTTYINAVHPLAGVYDGFLVHSRGDGAPAPTADREAFDGSVRIRTDLDEPVFIYETETDINLLAYARARQDDSPSVHTWEVAGTAHSDAWALAIAGGLEADASLGAFIGCQTPINDGPHHETLLAAVHHLAAWVVDGTAPPSAPRIEVDGLDGPPDGELTIVRDDLGIAVGGVRTPVVDAPNRTLSGDPGGDEDGFCFLFGQTQPIDPAALVERYGDIAGYRAELQAAADASVAAGWLLPDDAATMVDEEAARASDLGLS
jgi:hypothetical protein